MGARFFADVDSFRSCRHPIQQIGINEMVVNYEVGAFEALTSLQSQEQGIAWTRSHKITNSFWHQGHDDPVACSKEILLIAG
jgi:hypothetical protein